MQQTYAQRKSRIIFHRADRWAPSLRSVGRITIVGPKWKQPIVLKGGFSVLVTESRRQNLRKALIRFHDGPAGSFWNWFVFLAAFGLGVAATRNFYEFFVLR